MEYLKPFHTDQMSLIRNLLSSEFGVVDLRSQRHKFKKLVHKKIIITPEQVVKKAFSYKVDLEKELYQVEGKDKLDLLLFSKKTEAEVESSSSDQEEKMESLLPGIETRNQYIRKLIESTENRILESKNYLKKEFKEQRIRIEDEAHLQSGTIKVLVKKAIEEQFEK